MKGSPKPKRQLRITANHISKKTPKMLVLSTQPVFITADLGCFADHENESSFKAECSRELSKEKDSRLALLAEQLS